MATEEAFLDKRSRWYVKGITIWNGMVQERKGKTVGWSRV
jgi:hypothetical protein